MSYSIYLNFSFNDLKYDWKVVFAENICNYSILKTQGLLEANPPKINHCTAATFYNERLRTLFPY